MPYRVYSVNRITGREEQMRYDFETRNCGWEEGPGALFPDLRTVYDATHPIIDKWQSWGRDMAQIRWCAQ